MVAVVISMEICHIHNANKMLWYLYKYLKLTLYKLN